MVSGNLLAAADCQEFLLGPGDILYLPPGTLFSYQAEGAELDRLLLAPPVMADAAVRPEAGRFPFFCIQADRGEAAPQLDPLF